MHKSQEKKQTRPTDLTSSYGVSPGLEDWSTAVSDKYVHITHYKSEETKVEVYRWQLLSSSPSVAWSREVSAALAVFPHRAFRILHGDMFVDLQIRHAPSNTIQCVLAEFGDKLEFMSKIDSIRQVQTGNNTEIIQLSLPGILFNFLMSR
jgi:hypothetical protein